MNRSHRNRAAVTLAALATLSIAIAGRAARAAEPDPAPFVTAQADFERGLAGDGTANERANAQFQMLVEAEPGNPLYLAYLGSTFTILGRDAWAPWTKMRQSEKGLGLLDKALALLTPAHDQQQVRGVPVSEEVRLTAASTFLAVPGFMNRTAAARPVVADALSSPAFAAAPGPIRARLHLLSSQLAQKDSKPAEEAQALRQAVAAAPDAPTAAQANARLKELGL